MQGIADKDYFLDDKGMIAADEESAATLLIRKGQEVPKEMADKYGIGKVTPDEDEDESVKSESQKSNKAEKPAKNKGAK